MIKKADEMGSCPARAGCYLQWHSVTESYVLVTHAGGRCVGHIEWTDLGTTLVIDHCECGGEPIVPDFPAEARQ
jgi:hypothetical protein